MYRYFYQSGIKKRCGIIFFMEEIQHNKVKCYAEIIISLHLPNAEHMKNYHIYDMPAQQKNIEKQKDLFFRKESRRKVEFFF